MIDIIFYSVLAFLFSIIFANPFYGLWIWILNNFIQVSRFANPSFPGKLSPIIVFDILMVLSVLSRLKKKDVRLVFSDRTNLYLIIYMLLCFLSLFLQEEVDLSENLDYFSHNYLLSVIFYFVFLFLVNNEYRISMILRIIMIVTLLLCFTMLSDYYKISSSIIVSDSTGLYRTGGIVVNPNAAGVLAFTFIPIYFMFFLIERFKSKKRLISFLILLCFIILGLSVSRGAVIACLFSLGYFIFRARKVTKLNFTVVMGIIIIWIFSASLYQARFKELFGKSIEEIDRYKLAIIGFNMIRANPFFGVGGNNMLTVFDKYNTVGYPFPHTLHNNYIQIVAESGIPASIFYMLFIIGIWNKLNQLGLLEKYKFIALSLKATIIGWLIFGLTGNFIVNFPFLLICGLIWRYWCSATIEK